MSYERPSKEITGADIAFPANVIGRFLPKREEIPHDFFKSGNKWTELAFKLFYEGGRNVTFRWKPEIDTDDAFKHLKVCLGSYQPKHEHKGAGVGYLLSLWLEGFDA